MALKNLVAGQYQIGNTIMGYGTQIKMEKFEVAPYDVTNTDYQLPRSDEKRFGFDQLTPTTLVLTMSVLRNYIRDNAHNNGLGLTNAIFNDFPKIADLQREWRADRERKIWNEMKPLYVCGLLDGITRIVWGRPGQFTYARPTKLTEWLQCLGEFRRADTLSYNATEFIAFMTQAVPVRTILGTGGDATSWFRILIAGPINDPTLSFTSDKGSLVGTIALDYDVAPGEIIEISSYPWSRFTVSNTGENLSATHFGTIRYLDKLHFDYDESVTCTMTGSAMTGATAAGIAFRDAYQVIE
jgi:hypothetical protein